MSERARYPDRSKMSPDEIERRVVEAFIVPGRRERYLYALTRPKKRHQVLDRLNHWISDVDERYRVLIPRGRQFPKHIEAALTAKGAPDECYVMSSSSEFDGKTMVLHDALCGVVGVGIGTIISCIPGRLAYYEAEDVNERYVLEGTGR